MARYQYVVLTNPVVGKEDEYNRWYSEQHLPDVLNVPGFVAAQRFRIADGNDSLSGCRYLALYELETEDPAAALAELQSRAGSAAMPLSDALDFAQVSATLWNPLGERVVKQS